MGTEGAELISTAACLLESAAGRLGHRTQKAVYKRRRDAEGGNRSSAQFS